MRLAPLLTWRRIPALNDHDRVTKLDLGQPDVSAEQ
jgi:hypothetical protein